MEGDEYVDVRYDINMILYGKKTRSDELYGHIESMLKEIVEIIMRSALAKVTISDAYNYTILGGKAINNIISEEYLQKSFDYDIHVTDSSDEVHLNHFGSNLASQINTFLDSHLIYKHYIYKILYSNWLISDDPKFFEHYIKNPLFSYGYRKKRNYVIHGIFLHLYFNDDIFGKFKYTNSKNYIGNHIFYPVSDIDLDLGLTFGILANKYTLVNPYDNLRYAKFPLVAFNLFSYINKGGYKVNRNMEKKYHFMNINNYKCSFFNSNDDNITDIKQIIDTLKNPAILRGEDIHLTGKLNIANEMRNLLTVVEHNENKSNLCLQNVVATSTNTNNYNNTIFINGITDDHIRELEGIVIENDKDHKYSLFYTSSHGFNSSINRYLQNSNMGIEININDYMLTGEYQFEYDPNNISTYAEELSNIIRKSNSEINKDFFLDTFWLYRFHSICMFDDVDGRIFDTSSFTPNTILSIPYFMSTSFSPYFEFESLLKNNTVLLKILVNKSSNNWLFLNNYSHYPQEHEILLNKGIYLHVKNIEYKNIMVAGRVRDIKVVIVELLDHFLDANDGEFFKQLFKDAEKAEDDIKPKTPPPIDFDKEDEKVILDPNDEIIQQILKELFDPDNTGTPKTPPPMYDDNLNGGKMQYMTKKRDRYVKPQYVKQVQKNIKLIDFKNHSNSQKNILKKPKALTITKNIKLINFKNHSSNAGYMYDLSCENIGNSFVDDMALYMKIYKKFTISRKDHFLLRKPL